MRFSRRGKERIIVVAILVGIILVGQVILARRNMSLVENGVGGIFNWANRGLSTVYSLFVDEEKVMKEKRSKADLIEENEALKIEVEKLQRLIDDSKMLGDEQKLRDAMAYSLVLARVIAKEPGNWFQRVTINVGSTSGAEVGQTVVTAVELENRIVVTGLVGRVSEVGLDWAKVNTMVDEENGASFYNSRTQDGGFIKSTLEGKLQGFMFDEESDIIEGDRLFTSGLGGVYQPDIYLGSVEEVGSDEAGMVKRVVIKPGVNFHKLSRVFVISE